MSVKVKPSVVVDYQAPEFIRSDYAKFITFLQKYYEYLEQNNKALDVLQNLDTFNDVDEQTDDTILGVMYSLFLPDFPQILAADKKFLLKHIVEFYSSKGSIDSIKSFFRIVYGEEVDVYLPKVDILKLDAGVWRKLFKIKASSISSGTVYELLGQEIYQLDPVTGNKTVSAIVVDYEEATGSIVITADNIVLNFDSSLPVYSTRNDTGAAVTIQLSNQLSTETITYSGLNYSIGDVVKISSAVSNTESIVVDKVGTGTVKNLIINATGDGYSTQDEISFDDNYKFDASSSSFVDVAEDTITLYSHSLQVGDSVTYRVEPDTTYAGAVIGGLTDGATYFVIPVDSSKIKLATTVDNAINSIPVDLTSLGAGTNHYIVYAVPGTSGARAKITRVASDDLTLENADSLGDFPFLMDDEDRVLLENGFQIREEYGEQPVFKSLNPTKFSSDDHEENYNPGSLTSKEFSFLLEKQENDTITYNRSSYVKSNGLVRQLMPAFSDISDNFGLEWANNEGLTVTLTDEELRVGFAYDTSYGASGAVTPKYPLTFVIEFQSNEDYNNLEYYELVRSWGTTNVPEVKTLMDPDYYTGVNHDDFTYYSELAQCGIHPEGVRTNNPGATVSQRGFDLSKKPIMVIRELGSSQNAGFPSDVVSSQRPWEYRFVFRQNTTVNLKVFVNSQPNKVWNQLFETEIDEIITYEDDSLPIQEDYRTTEVYGLQPALATTSEYAVVKDQIGNAVDATQIFSKYDKVTVYSNDTDDTGLFNVMPTFRVDYAYSNKIPRKSQVVGTATGVPMIVTLQENGSVVTLSNGGSGLDTVISSSYVVFLTNANRWAGFAVNENNKVVIAAKSPTNIFGSSDLYQPTNEFYSFTVASNGIPSGVTQGSLPELGVWGNIAYGNGRYVVTQGTGNPMLEPVQKFVSGSRAAVSTDGTNWTVGAMPSGDCWTNLKYVNNRFWALPYGKTVDDVNGNAYGDGVDGETITINAPPGAVFSRVLFASYGTPTGSNGNYAINPAQHAQNSVDIISQLAVGKSTLRVNVGVSTFGNDPAPGVTKRLYILLEYQYSSTTTALTSLDGVTWEPVPLPFSKAADIAYGNGMYIITTYNNDSVYYYSTDGKTWKPNRFPLNDADLNNYTPTGTSFWSTITYGADKFIATVANDPAKNTTARLHDKIAVSTDGMNWKLQGDSSFTTNLTTYAGSKGSIVQATYSPTFNIFHYVIGSWTFTPVVSNTTYNLDGVAYTGGGYNGVAGGNLTEVDAFNMTTQVSSNPSVTLITPRYFPTAMSSTAIGFWFGGWRDSIGASDEIDGVRYSDQTSINPAAVAAVPGGHNSGGTATNYTEKGYQLGGYNNASISNIQRFTYDTWVTTNLAATLSQIRYGGGNVHSLVTQKSYCLNGYNTGTTSMTNEIDGVDMTSETAINPSAVIALAKNYVGGWSSRNTQKGYSVGGDPGPTSRIDAFDFSTETSYLASATLSSARSWVSGANDFVNGFAIGGSITTEIDGMAFATETAINPAATMSVNRYYYSTNSQYPSSTSYTSTSYHNLTINGDGASEIFYTRPQLTNGKSYYVSYLSPGPTDLDQISFATTKENAIAGISVKLDSTVKNGTIYVRSITDKITAGVPDAFNKVTKDAQLTIYAKKRSVGTRDAGMKYYRDPNVAVFDDVERENINYTTDDKYYIHESIAENTDYIIMEREDYATSDQVNLALEIDKRTEYETSNYVTYPYLATETSVVSYVKPISDIEFPDYSQVRVYVDKAVLQSVNNINRQSHIRIYNDYANLGPDHDSTHLNTDREIYQNLSDPIISSTDAETTYRNNYNLVVNGFENLPYLNGYIPATHNEYSSGPGEFGNTGITSFVNDMPVITNSLNDREDEFLKITISPEQDYYDNDPTKKATNRTFHTMEFNLPKEYGEKFTSPLSVALHNMTDSHSYNLSNKFVDSGDKLYLDSGERVASITQAYRKVPVNPYIVGSGITTIESNSDTPYVWTVGLARQNFPAWRDTVAKNVQNGSRIMLSSGGGAAGSLSSWETYQNLPSYLIGLDWLDSINDSDAFTIYFTHPTTVYMIWNTAWSAVDKTGWTLVETTTQQLVSNVAGTFQVYSRRFVAGNSTFDNTSALYLFKYENVGTQIGSSFFKVGNANNTWDSHIYSNRGFTKNCYVRFQADVPQNGQNIAMVGLNTDPTADASYTSLDFSWYASDPSTTGRNGVSIYENGSSIQGFGYIGTRDTVYEIWYDGSFVYYILDGQVVRRVARATGAPLYLDSSFYYVFPTTGAPLGVRNLEFGELIPVNREVAPPPIVEDVDGTEILLEDGSATIAPESANYGRYGLNTSNIAIEFFSPSLAKSVANSGVDNSNMQYHMVFYCDKIDYINVSTDATHTTYELYNCWSPSGSNFPSTYFKQRDYVITIRDMSESDYIIKRKNDQLNRQTSAATEKMYKDVWIAKGENDYGKYVKFYSTYANAVSGTSPLALNTLGIGSSTLAAVGEDPTDTAIIEDGKTAHSYYGSMIESDILTTFEFDAADDVGVSGANTIRLYNHELGTGDQVIFRKAFNGLLPAGGLVDNSTYFVTVVDADTIKLSTTDANRIAGTFVTITALADPGYEVECYLQLRPSSLYFGSTEFAVNTRGRYTIAGSKLLNITETTAIAANIDSKTVTIDGRTDILQLSSTLNAFNEPMQFQTGTAVAIILGAGDSIMNYDGQVTYGPATVRAYVVKHSDTTMSLVEYYHDAIAGQVFLSGFYNSSQSVFTNTLFANDQSYISGNAFYMPIGAKHNLPIGTAVKIKSTGIGLTNGVQYYVASTNWTDTSFSVTTNADATGVTTLTPTTQSGLASILVNSSPSKDIHAPMITGTIVENVMLSYVQSALRETGSIQNVELQSVGSYTRIPTPTIIPLEGRLGSGAEIYPIVDGIGAVKGVDFLDGGTHSVNRTMYLPYSFFSSTVTGNWQIGEQVLLSGTAIGTLDEKNGRYFKVIQNGSATVITFGDTLTGATSGATAVVGRSVNISAVTNARPALVTTATAHYLNSGDSVYISGINSTVAAGTYYVSVVGANSFQLFTDITRSTAVDTRATSAYTSGGTVATGIYTATGTAIPAEVTLSSANGPSNNYDNDKNLLLPTTKLQDSYYYQDYSYAIRSGTSYENWKPYFNKLVHPAGIAVFGEIDYSSLNSSGTLLGNTTVVSGQINNTKTAISSTVTTT